ncbi:MAG: branched-chain amino acid ABC transporter permease [Nitriliruptoraceae bacterium]
MKRPVIIASVALVAIFMLPLILNTFHLSVATRILVLALFAVAFNLVFGFGGMPSLGHAAYFGVGGYTLGLFATGTELPILVIITLAILFGGGLGALIGVLTLRTNGIYLLLLTLAAAQALYGLAFQQVRLTGGDNGIAGISRNLLPFVTDTASFVRVTGVIVVTALVVLYLVSQSVTGLALHAHRIAPERLQALGFNVQRLRITAFSVSGAFSSLAGVLFVFTNRFVGPENLTWSISAAVMLYAIFGGARYFTGPIVGAATLTVIETVVSGVTTRWLTVLGLTYILVVMFLPDGLLGRAHTLFTRTQQQARS